MADGSRRGTAGAHTVAGGRRFGYWLAAVACLLMLVGVVWASDWITLQDERTVFTATCERGAWQGARCS